MQNKLNKWDCIIDPILKNNIQIGGLFIGDIDCAQNVELLKSLKIGALLSVIDEPQFTVPQEIIHERIDVPDCSDLNLVEYFPRTNEFIDRHRQHTNVMVHCFAGISRSASVVIAYIMNKFQWGYQRTLNTVVARRRQVKPNQGFIKQLQQYEKTNKDRPNSQHNKILTTINNVYSRIPNNNLKQSINFTKYDYGNTFENKQYPPKNTYFQPNKFDLNSLEIEISKRQNDLQNLKSKYNELSKRIQNRTYSVYVQKNQDS